MAAETRKSRKANFTQEEVDVLVTTVRQNHDLLYGETSKSFFHKEIRNQVWNIVLEEVNKVSLERRTLNEIKNKWKKCQYSPVKNNDSFGSGSQDSLDNDELAHQRFGISEETIKRWRRSKSDILEKAQQSIRRSQRHALGHGSFSETSPPVVKKDSADKVPQPVDEGGTIADIDSMPLQQRLSQSDPAPIPTQPQDTVLHSQPISPTKLKVTRQGKPQQPPPKPPTPLPPPPPPPPPQVCLKWDSHHTHMQAAFPNLLTKEQYVDATLVSEGQTLKCHRMILSSCSPYFEEVLNGIGPFQHPVLFMRDVPFWILKALCDFMYAGEVHILQDRLQELLNVATSLKIKGLASPPTNEEVKPTPPPIKQDIEPVVPPKIPVKEEKKEERPSPAPSPKPPKHDLKAPKHEVKTPKHEVKPPKHEVKPVKTEVKPQKQETPKPKQDVIKISRRKEEKRLRHSSQPPKEKEKVVEEPPPKVALKITPQRIVAKIPPAPKAPTRNVVRNVVKSIVKPIVKPVEKPVSKPSGSKISTRKSEAARRNDRIKAETVVFKEKEKEKEKPILKKDNINDPLDLLQPVYEEIAKVDPLPPIKTSSPGKLRERGNVQVRRGVSRSVNRKVRKRRYAEVCDDLDESPPPPFHSRKGTRSRPHVKIPKFFHSHYDSPNDATIVREPHTDQNDPLIGVEVEEIKAEPVDVEENNIEMEDNLVNFMAQDQDLSQEGEEIIGNYDSPLVNIKREHKRNTPNIFKKELESQPAILGLHATAGVDAFLNIKQESIDENVHIVDIAKISKAASHIEESFTSFGSMEVTQEKTTEIIISSVQSMAGLPEESLIKDQEKKISEETSGSLSEEPVVIQHLLGSPQILTSELDPLAAATESETPPLNFRIEDVRSGVEIGESISSKENVIGDMDDKEVPKCQIEVKEVIEEEVNDVRVDDSGALQKHLEEVVGTKEIPTSEPEDMLQVTSSDEQPMKHSAQLNIDELGPTQDTESSEKNRDSELDPCEQKSETIDNVQEENITATTSELSIGPIQSCDNISTEGIEKETKSSHCVREMNADNVTPTIRDNLDSEASPLYPEKASFSEEITPVIESAAETALIPNNIDSLNDEMCTSTVIVSQGIEAELEQCLASTSSDMPEIKSVENKIKLTVKPLPLDEDFTKDIEFDNFMSTNRPTNYLGESFEGGFDMEELPETFNDAAKDYDTGQIESDDVEMKDEEAVGEFEGVMRLSENNIDALRLKNTGTSAIGDASIDRLPEVSLEDEEKLENSLLADLDEDIVMADASSSQEGEEKTLEMIVNALNESLGEISK